MLQVRGRTGTTERVRVRGRVAFSFGAGGAGLMGWRWRKLVTVAKSCAVRMIARRNTTDCSAEG